MTRFHPVLRLQVLILAFGAVLALVLLNAEPVRSGQNPPSPSSGRVLPPPRAVNNQTALASPKPKEEPRKSNLEKTKSDAAALSALADQLRDELNKMNVNILSVDVIEKSEKVEQLAKKIKGEANED